jgi:hypothetical protein
MLVSYKVELIIISFKIYLFSAWYGWKTTITHTYCVWSFLVISMTSYFQLFVKYLFPAWQTQQFPFFMSSQSASTRIILNLVSSFTFAVYFISDYQVCWVHTSCLLWLYVSRSIFLLILQHHRPTLVIDLKFRYMSIVVPDSRTGSLKEESTRWFICNWSVMCLERSKE